MVKTPKRFSDAEKAAMKDRARELMDKTNGESAVLAKISQLKGQDHVIAKRLHEIITANVPSLIPKTWYGFPAYANKDGKVICFFQYAQKFNTRYATFGFSDLAKLDEGDMWPVTFALKKLTAAEETKIIALVKKAVG